MFKKSKPRCRSAVGSLGSLRTRPTTKVFSSSIPEPVWVGWPRPRIKSRVDLTFRKCQGASGFALGGVRNTRNKFETARARSRATLGSENARPPNQQTDQPWSLHLHFEFVEQGVVRGDGRCLEGLRAPTSRSCAAARYVDVTTTSWTYRWSGRCLGPQPLPS